MDNKPIHIRLGIGMGKTCKLKDVSFQSMTKKKKKLLFRTLGQLI